MSDESPPIVQGSPEWRALRLGKITASRFHDVLTQPRTKAAQEKGELSQTAQSYLLELVAEILTGQDQEPPPNAAMRWGTDNEPIARQIYEELMGVEVEQVAFVSHLEEPMIGGSPDGLVGEEGGVEIKCPWNTRVHLGYMLNGHLPKLFRAQVQGLLWLRGCKWWDFVSYDPRIIGSGSLRLALWRHRVWRDQAFIDSLVKSVFGFRDALLNTLCSLKIGGSLHGRGD